MQVALLFFIVTSSTSFNGLEEQIEQLRSKVAKSRAAILSSQDMLRDNMDKSSRIRYVDNRLRSAPIKWGGIRIPLMCDVKLAYLKLRRSKIEVSISRLSESIKHANVKLSEIEHAIASRDLHGAAASLGKLTECTGLD